MNSPSNLNGYYEIIGPDPINVYCYQKCQTKLILVTIGTFLTFGILLVVLNWSKSWKFDMICRRCSVKEADRVLLQDEYGCYYETKLNRGPGGTNGESSPNNTGFYFTHQKIKYIFDDTKNSFSVIKKFDEGKLFIDFYGKRGLTDAEVTRNVTVFGKNRIDVDTLPLRQLILNEILNPFYLFQFYTVVIWIIVQYELYAVTVLILSIISLTWTIWEVRKQSTALKKKISEQFDVRVSRNNKMISLAMEDLVPGDCLFFACGEKLRMPCDAILLDGHCIVNEAMLTGESTPVTKTTAPKNKTKFDYLKHRDHILFRGSEVLQLTNPSKAGCELVVIRTGFYTEKGSLVRSILYPKPVDFRFLSDFYRFIPILLSFGTIGMFYSAYCWYKNGGTWTQIIFLSLDVVTWCVPPLLPSCMASISGFFQKYLRKSNVYCINSKSIYMASSVDTVCFDKTGTLTEDSLRLKGVYCNVTTDLIMSPQVLDDDSPIKITMGTCHSLCLIGGKIQGTPLEVEMFKSTGWSYYW